MSSTEKSWTLFEYTPRSDKLFHILLDVPAFKDASTPPVLKPNIEKLLHVLCQFIPMLESKRPKLATIRVQSRDGEPLHKTSHKEKEAEHYTFSVYDSDKRRSQGYHVYPLDESGYPIGSHEFWPIIPPAKPVEMESKYLEAMREAPKYVIDASGTIAVSPDADAIATLELLPGVESRLLVDYKTDL
ncbi:MAG: hypothetical protein Q9162_006835 [Coniocarpon cinnabarinum]